MAASNRDLIKSAANGHWPEILSAVGGIDLNILDGKHHPCPKCGGVDRFRAFNDFTETGGVICNQCFDQKNGDGISTVRWLTGANFGEALLLIAGYLQIDIDAKWESNGHQITDVVAEIAKLKSIPLDFLKSFGAENAKRGKLAVCRLPMFGPDGERCSSFDMATIDKKWLKGIGLKSKPVGLFLRNATLPEPGQTVHITEGVKDSAALDAEGFRTVGIPRSDMAVKFATCFSSCHVVIVPDRDRPGENGSRKTAARLAGVAASVRIATLPGELKSKDGDGVREILALQDGSSLLKRAIDDASEWDLEADGNGDEKLPLILVDEGKTDLANARRFAKLHGDKTRYCHPWGKWLVWDGRRWKVDDTGETIRLAKQVADSIWDEAKSVGNYGEEAEQKARSFAAKTSSKLRIDAMLSLAQSEDSIPVLPNQLDADPFLLNCINGTIDLRTGEIREHRQLDLITKLSPTQFSMDAESYQWDRFLESIFGDDNDLILFLQRFMGYALTGDVREQIMLILFGSGANGKSTFLNAITDVFGPDFSMKSTSDLLLHSRNEGHPTKLTDLFGKRLVISVETGDGRSLNEALVKELVGGDKIRARRMREDFWEFSPTHKLVVATNHKPRVRGTDHAIWRRLALVPFNVRFWDSGKGETGPGNLKADKTLQEKLTVESEGVLRWMVQGCREWLSHGLLMPSSVKAATSDYRQAEDVIKEFVSDSCVTGNDNTVRSKELYAEYAQWSKTSGERPMSRTKFGRSLAEAGYLKRKSGDIWWDGLQLTE